jgi:hypothetical protein
VGAPEEEAGAPVAGAAVVAAGAPVVGRPGPLPPPIGESDVAGAELGVPVVSARGTSLGGAVPTRTPPSSVVGASVPAAGAPVVGRPGPWPPPIGESDTAGAELGVPVARAGLGAAVRFLSYHVGLYPFVELGNLTLRSVGTSLHLTAEGRKLREVNTRDTVEGEYIAVLEGRNGS